MNHLPKCAGNSVAHHFKVILGSDRVREIRPAVDRDVKPHDLSQFVFVYGHLSLPLEEQIGVGRHRFSLMRDPVDRVLSAYFFFMQLKAANSPLVANARSMDLEEYVTSDEPNICRTTCNEQSRQLLGLQGLGPTEPAEANKIVANRLHLLDRFLAVGIYEQLQLSLDLISWTLAIPRMRAGVVVNRTHRRWQSQRFSEGVLEAIKVRNQVDLALYALVADRFEAAVDRMSEEFVSRNYFDSRPAATSRYTQTIDLGGPIPGSGWHLPETAEGGSFRWMGGKLGASVYLDGRCGGTARIRFFLAHVHPAAAGADIVIRLDGVQMRHRILRSRSRTLIVAIRQELPMRNGHVLTISTTKWRPPIPEDGRELALGVSRIEVRCSKVEVAGRGC